MKTYTDELTPIDSADPVFKIANWYEREVSQYLHQLGKKFDYHREQIVLLFLSSAWCMSESICSFSGSDMGCCFAAIAVTVFETNFGLEVNMIKH